MNLQHFLEKSVRDHSHLCPRQILGVRMGLCGMKALGFDKPPVDKRLLIITETDGCFVDGLSAATNCTVGHRTLRVEDYGKPAAVFVDVHAVHAVRLAPALDIRQRACAGIEDESLRYMAQMQSYRTMTDEEMFSISEVALNTSIESIVSHPGLRVNCDLCREEIMNEREIRRNGMTLCRSCSGDSYYRAMSDEVILPLVLDGNGSAKIE